MSLRWGDGIKKKRWFTEPKLKWSSKFSEKELKYFNKKIPKAEEINDWSWWAIFGAVIVMGVLFILKILGKI